MNVIEGQDIFADDFIRQEGLLKESTMPTEIQQFFDGATIFLTGGTGFVGSVLMEKLLRTCWRLKKIYLLLRPKKGKSLEERLNGLLEGELFVPLKRQRPNFREKITLIHGDLIKGEGIISEEDRDTLIKTVDIIIHCAATVRFDEKLRTAVSINLKSSKEMLNMAHEMKNLKAFIHVSTAYSNCPMKEIGEQFYPPPFNYKKITTLVDQLDDNLLERLTPELIDKWPNTYAFSKIITEDMIREYGKGLPIAILRPSIVISTYREPLAGYINNYYGPQGVVIGAALGVLRTLHCDPNVIADMVPVDLVVNAIIALAWDIGQTKGDNPNFEKISWKEENFDDNSNVKKPEASDEIPILNSVSSARNPITWGKFLYYNYEAGKTTSSMSQMWHSSITLNKNEKINLIYRVGCHYIPAVVVDTALTLMGKKPMLLKSYRKIDKFTKLISYFSTDQWKFKEDNLLKLWNKMSPRDKEIFNFSIEELDWEIYLMRYLKGIQMYMLRDKSDSHEEGMRKKKKLKILHFSLVAILNLLLCLFLWWIYSLLFG